MHKTIFYKCVERKCSKPVGQWSLNHIIINLSPFKCWKNTDFFDYICHNWNNYSFWASVPNVKRVRYCGFELRAALLLVETKERENARMLAKIQTPTSAVLYYLTPQAKIFPFHTSKIRRIQWWVSDST